jgi:hypothetical protein
MAWFDHATRYFRYEICYTVLLFLANLCFSLQRHFVDRFHWHIEVHSFFPVAFSSCMK